MLNGAIIAISKEINITTSRTNAVALLMLISASMLNSRCKNTEAEELAQLSEMCKNFEFVLPQWRSAAEALKGRINSGAVDPYRDLQIEDAAESSGIGQEVPDEITVTVYKVYEGEDFRLNLRWPTFNRANAIGLSAPATTPFNCQGAWFEHL